MPERPNTADRMLGLLVVVATLATIAMNALAALGLINGVTPATISDRHPSLITPAGYAFSIWALIYLWLVAFSIYQMLPTASERVRSIRWLYLASCVLNAAWLFFWHHGQVAFCFVLILLLAGVLALIVGRLAEPTTLREAALTKAPFGIYFGWVTCAMLVNLNILAMNLGEMSTLLLGLAILSLAFAAAAAVFVTVKFKNYLFPLAAAWALTAIAIKQTGSTLIITTAAFAAIICMLASGTIVTKLRDSTSE